MGMHPSTNEGKIVEAKDQAMHEPQSPINREAQSITNLINAGKAKMARTASLQSWQFRKKGNQGPRRKFPLLSAPSKIYVLDLDTAIKSNVNVPGRFHPSMSPCGCTVEITSCMN